MMKWEVPSFAEIKMDSEIGSYQDDFGDVPDATEQSEKATTRLDERSS